MTFVTILNETRKSCPPLHVKYCVTFWDNFKGLMFQPQISKDGGALLVEPRDSRANTAIHMFFMRFDIAAIWINSAFEVVDCKLAKKWSAAIIPAAEARYVLETHPQNLAHFQPGDRIVIKND